MSSERYILLCSHPYVKSHVCKVTIGYIRLAASDLMQARFVRGAPGSGLTDASIPFPAERRLAGAAASLVGSKFSRFVLPPASLSE